MRRKRESSERTCSDGRKWGDIGCERGSREEVTRSGARDLLKRPRIDILDVGRRENTEKNKTARTIERERGEG